MLAGAGGSPARVLGVVATETIASRRKRQRLAIADLEDLAISAPRLLSARGLGRMALPTLQGTVV
jgi:hypothetical protein